MCRLSQLKYILTHLEQDPTTIQTLSLSITHTRAHTHTYKHKHDYRDLQTPIGLRAD